MQITSGKIPGAQKVVIYGPEGIGKSVFASQFPNPIFIDTEGSTKKLDVSRLPKPSSWAMLLEQVRYIKANPTLCSTLIIDTADWAEILCVEHICATKLPPKGKDTVTGIEDFGYGKGYTYLAEEFGRLLNLLEDLIAIGINVVLTAHAKMRKFELPDELGTYDRWEMKLGKNTAPLVKEWADMVLFANYKTYVVNVDSQGAAKGKNKAQGGSRVMYTSHHPCWDAKNRDGLPDELPLKYSEIAHLIPSDKVQLSTTISPSPPVPQPSSTISKALSEEKAPKPAKPAQSEFVPPEGYTDITSQWQENQPVNDKIPKELRDLMVENDVTEAEIQGVVFKKKYFPEDTPIENYPKGFIMDVLVAAWPQVYQAVLDGRDLPF